jgi:hypothetical protein
MIHPRGYGISRIQAPKKQPATSFDEVAGREF